MSVIHATMIAASFIPWILIVLVTGHLVRRAYRALKKG